MGYLNPYYTIIMRFSPFIGCKNVFQQKLGTNCKVEDRLYFFGSHIYNQMQEVSRNGYPSSEQDLFLEQAVVSSWLGMKGSLNMYDAETVLTWQDPIGCYKEHKGDEKNTEQPRYYSLAC